MLDSRQFCDFVRSKARSINRSDQEFCKPFFIYKADLKKKKNLGVGGCRLIFHAFSFYCIEAVNIDCRNHSTLKGLIVMHSVIYWYSES